MEKGLADWLMGNRTSQRLVKETKAEGFDRFMNTLDEKMDLITNYSIRRQNSGFVKGLNHKIRVLLGRCYGYPTGHTYFSG